MSQFVKSKLNPEDCSIEELKKFARYGNAVASLCIEKKGGILSIPEEKETFKRLQLSVWKTIIVQNNWKYTIIASLSNLKI